MRYGSLVDLPSARDVAFNLLFKCAVVKPELTIVRVAAQLLLKVFPLLVNDYVFNFVS